MLQKMFRKIMGLDKLESSIQKAEEDLKIANERVAAAEQAQKLALEQEELAKLTPKERATRKKEPWVGVLNTHVNQDNIRNGFFELDWNNEFVLKLKQEGYGYDGDPDEEIVDRWFRDIVSQMLIEEGQDPTQRGAGYINVVPISKGKSEVS